MEIDIEELKEKFVLYVFCQSTYSYFDKKNDFQIDLQYKPDKVNFIEKKAIEIGELLSNSESTIYKETFSIKLIRTHLSNIKGQSEIRNLHTPLIDTLHYHISDGLHRSKLKEYSLKYSIEENFGFDKLGSVLIEFLSNQMFYVYLTDDLNRNDRPLNTIFNENTINKNNWISFFESIDIKKEPQLEPKIWRGEIGETYVQNCYTTSLIQHLYELKKKIGYLRDSSKLTYLIQLNLPLPQMPNFDHEAVNQGFYECDMHYYEFINDYIEYLKQKINLANSTQFHKNEDANNKKNTHKKKHITFENYSIKHEYIKLFFQSLKNENLFDEDNIFKGKFNDIKDEIHTIIKVLTDKKYLTEAPNSNNYLFATALGIKSNINDKTIRKTNWTAKNERYLYYSQIIPNLIK